MNVDNTFPGLDESVLYGWALETWNQAYEVVRGLPWTPVIVEVPFPSSPSATGFEILPYIDPETLPAELTSERWQLESWLTEGRFVPEVAELAWDLATHRPGSKSTGVRPRNQIVEYLASRSNRDYAPLGAQPSSTEIDGSVDPEGEPLHSIGTADWWLHRWAVGALAEETLVAARQQDPYLLIVDDATLLFIPSADSTFGGLLHSGPGEYAPGRDGHRGWAAFVAKWSRKWGAQLVSTGYMPAFTVERPPVNIAEAIPLALEHMVYCDHADRSGSSVYEWAYGLVGARHWTLSVKP